MGFFSKLGEFLEGPHHANANASNAKPPVAGGAKPKPAANPSTAQYVSEWSQALGHLSQAIPGAAPAKTSAPTPAKIAQPASTGAPQGQPQQHQQQYYQPQQQQQQYCPQQQGYPQQQYYDQKPQGDVYVTEIYQEQPEEEVVVEY
ncbi:uncharacterized protein PG986_005930 [Apiospora aurea]|uniref:Uncharacterized protein n=1 Tax=Apiospora aurea TaxID=335848 RepID=A0ABR1QIY8_9PEZI